MARSREIAISFDLRTTTLADVVVHSEHRPATAMAALMECTPHEEPQLSMEELAPLREAVAIALETVLTEREQWIFDGLYVRRLSWRQLSREMQLSRSHLERLVRGDQRPGKEYVGILEKLQAVLREHPAVKEWLNK